MMEEIFFTLGGSEECFDFALECFWEEVFEGAVEEFVSFIAEEHRSSRVRIDDDPIAFILDAHQEDGATRAVPVLEQDFFPQAVLSLNIIHDFIVESFVSLDRLQILHIQADHLLALGLAADSFETGLDFFLGLDPRQGGLIQFGEVRVVLVERIPELQVGH